MTYNVFGETFNLSAIAGKLMMMTKSLSVLVSCVCNSVLPIPISLFPLIVILAAVDLTFTAFLMLALVCFWWPTLEQPAT